MTTWKCNLCGLTIEHNIMPMFCNCGSWSFKEIKEDDLEEIDTAFDSCFTTNWNNDVSALEPDSSDNSSDNSSYSFDGGGGDFGGGVASGEF